MFKIFKIILICTTIVLFISKFGHTSEEKIKIRKNLFRLKFSVPLSINIEENEIKIETIIDKKINKSLLLFLDI